jgi:hypothetical protein
MKYGYNIIYIPVQNFLLQIFSFDPKKTERVISSFHEDRYAYSVKIEKTLAFLSLKPINELWKPETQTEMSLYQYEDKTTNTLNKTIKTVIQEIFWKSSHSE